AGPCLRGRAADRGAGGAGWRVLDSFPRAAGEGRDGAWASRDSGGRSWGAPLPTAPAVRGEGPGAAVIRRLPRAAGEGREGAGARRARVGAAGSARQGLLDQGP